MQKRDLEEGMRVKNLISGNTGIVIGFFLNDDDYVKIRRNKDNKEAEWAVRLLKQTPPLRQTSDGRIFGSLNGD
ncbi:MAG: hypothetical protein A2663_04490 [Candidatus Buchananbacteria bacterium RIFCSPHIGHO2_01_FULL_46_12]|uniref:Uncharacterized protein n=2 Tax=Candidatus Buchananiibacteriota TaxID=1817903 RepID=A0A1G1Y606_9BACT|nr:MAG: hypothetical protein A2663_04490 [Candidatus Buchananbacteria bacterium RIFCSPHIGHO2_01_FULL_46_12]OGY57099.1 MAG: hypothetical protein A3H67_02030 [Candidatus Buchananbacteria bacterium RIFCSPLOWO2_02_FULL_46_11b]